MSEDAGRERPYAIDYTPIVRHRSKQFTVGDLSLSKINGVDIQAASVALVPAVVIGMACAVVFLILGWTAFIALLPSTAVFGGTYWWFSRDSIDSQSPWDKVFMVATARRNAPIRISGGGQTVRTTNAVSELVGTKHHATDNHPTALNWVVIVKRSEPHHTAPNPAVPRRISYRPRPCGVELVVADDQHTYADWADYLAKPSL